MLASSCASAAMIWSTVSARRPARSVTPAYCMNCCVVARAVACVWIRLRAPLSAIARWKRPRASGNAIRRATLIEPAD